MQPHDKLIQMANQIAIFCASNPHGARKTAGVADHINNYWEPRMRQKLFDTVESGAIEGIHPLVLDAMAQIRRPSQPKSVV